MRSSRWRQPWRRQPQPAASIYESPDPPKPSGELDKIVFAKLAAMGIKPVLCSDAVFVRRAYLDVIGSLPTAAEARRLHRRHESRAQAPPR